MFNSIKNATFLILGSIRSVRKHWGHDFWYRLSRLGVIIPTVPAVPLAGSLARLAKAHTVEDAGKGLPRALQGKRPGPKQKHLDPNAATSATLGAGACHTAM
jgi:hypothetical protein